MDKKKNSGKKNKFSSCNIEIFNKKKKRKSKKP